jgi:hypothetical protein
VCVRDTTVGGRGCSDHDGQMVPSGVVIGVGCLLGVQLHIKKMEVLTSHFHSGAVASVGRGDYGHVVSEGDGT